jgi:hypothetical protein
MSTWLSRVYYITYLVRTNITWEPTVGGEGCIGTPTRQAVPLQLIVTGRRLAHG